MNEDKSLNGEVNDETFWEEISINIGWGIVRGKKVGNGNRKVLAVHGWLDNANSFDLVVPYIKKDTTIISLDLPGHGMSDHFSTGFIYDIESYVGSLKKVILQLDWNKFTFLSHSIGAVVGIVYCATFPEDINTFISIDIIKPWSIKPQNHASNLKKYFINYFKNEEHIDKIPLEYEEDELLEKCISASNSLDYESAKILMQRSSKPSSCGKKKILTRDLRVKVYFIGFISTDTWLEFAKTIKCPILIIKAKNGHNYESPDIYKAMRDAFEEGSCLYQYFEVEGKHHVHLTNPKMIGPILQDFFDISKRIAEKYTIDSC